MMANMILSLNMYQNLSIERYSSLSWENVDYNYAIDAEQLYSFAGNSPGIHRLKC